MATANTDEQAAHIKDQAFERYQAARVYIMLGFTDEAGPLLDQAMALWNQCPGADAGIASALHNTAVLYRGLGSHEVAAQAYLGAIARLRLMGADTELATVLNHLATHYFSMGKFAEAVPCLEEAIAIRRATLGPRAPALATGLSNLGEVYIELGKYADAEPLHREALTIYETLSPSNPADVAASQSKLGELYRLMGRLAEGQPLLEQALAARRAIYQAAHPELAESVQRLAALYRAMGQYTRAETLQRELVELRRTLYDVSDARVAAAERDLAVLYREMGNLDTAEQFYQQALDTYRMARGETSPEVADTLEGLAVVYRDMGEYAKAFEILRQTFEIRRSAQAADYPYQAGSLEILATLLTALASTEDPVREELLDQADALLSAHFPDLEHRGDGARWMYADKRALGLSALLYEGALHIHRAARGDRAAQVAQTMVRLADVYQALGDVVRAEQLYVQALEVRKEVYGPAHPEVAQLLDDFGGFYIRAGRYTKAEQRFRESLSAWRAVVGADHPFVVSILTNLGAALRLMGRYEEARSALEEALAIARGARDQNPTVFVAALHHIGKLYERMGNHAQAQAMLDEAQEAARTLPPEDPYARVVAAGILAPAEPAPAPATARAGAQGNRLLLLIDAMERAQQALTRSDFMTANLLYRMAIGTFQEELGLDHPIMADAAAGLGMLYLHTGDPDQAEYWMKRALEARRARLGENHPDVAASLSMLGVLYFSKRDYTQAEPLMEQALEIYRTVLMDAHPDLADARKNLAALYVATGRVEQALALMEQGLASDGLMLGQVFGTDADERRLAYLRSLRTYDEPFLSIIAGYLPDSQRAVQAGLDLLLRRKAVAAEALAVQRASVLGGRYPHLQPKLQQLTALRNRIAGAIMAGAGEETPGQYQAHIETLTTQARQLETELTRQIQEMNLELRLREANHMSVAARLPAGSALVEFVHFFPFDFEAEGFGRVRWKPGRYLAFVLRAGELEEVQMVDLGEARAIDQLIAAYRAAITGEGQTGTRPATRRAQAAPQAAGEGQHREAILASTRHLASSQRTRTRTLRRKEGQELRRALFDPLLPALAGRKRLFVAPDGNLALLPFEAMPLDAEGFLIDTYQISYLGVGRDILRFGVPAFGQPSAPLVAADPNFDLGGVESESGGVFLPLEGTRLEGKRVANQLGVAPRLRGEVLESTLKSIQSPRILHIATHGFFQPDPEPEETPNDGASLTSLGRLAGRRLENPLLRSGLALAGANTWLRHGALPPEAEDGILFAEDVTGLDLLDTQLVVLSACDTGLGQIQVGEGVFGLRRAFVIAGAKTLVMSLWKVPDKQTRLLMELFYENLLEKGLGRAEALRQAQLVLRRQYPKQPFYWGAFICQGDPDPLARQG